MSVVDDATKKKLRKGFRRRRKDAAEFSHQADEQIEKLLIRRFDRLVSVRKFILLWTALFVLLIFATVAQIRALSPYYQKLSPVPGGIYSEGVTGTFSNANPIYANSSVDAAVSRLVFSGLLKYDKNNNLVGDLAKNWSLDDSQRRYTVNLKKDIKWHDGIAFNADDVTFTYQTIQRAEAQSVLYSSWQGIKVTKKDAYTVIFELPNALSSFPYSLTNGILPKHSFKNIAPERMRSASFNSSPIGTGPFEWKFIETIGTNNSNRQQRISLAANDDYHAGSPKLDGFNMVTFANEQQFIDAFNKKQIIAMSGLSFVPPEIADDENAKIYRTPLSSIVMSFFNTSMPLLSDLDIRRALLKSVDHNKVVSVPEYPVNAISGPLLPGQLGYDPLITQQPYELAAANQLLEKKGWIKGANGLRSKDGQALKFNLASENIREYTLIAQFLQTEWGKLGVKVDVQYYSSEDLQGAIIANHDYDILLYGINIGVDPDVFAYWDSSQAGVTSQSHLNLSEYKSAIADQALQSARTRNDPALRIAKYRQFLTIWSQEAPALALYQPSSLYISRGEVFNFQRKSANSSADRFYNVDEWMVRQRNQNL